MMNKAFQLVIILILGISIFSCKKEIKNGIQGTISDAANETIYIDQLSFDRSTMTVAQGVLDDSGNFSIELKEPIEGGAYRARIKNKSIPFVTPGGDMVLNIKGTLEEIGNFDAEINVNPATTELLTKMKAFQKRELDLQAVTSYIIKDADPLVAMQMSMMVFGGNDKYISVYQEVNKKLKASYPNLKSVKAFDGFVSQANKAYQRRMDQEKIKVGMDAPDIVLKDPKGKTRKLSDLKGKVVLLDFWASWCGPCRRANPEVVAIYNKYKAKGFDVFSVSLDGVDDRTRARIIDEAKINQQLERAKKKWKDAIVKDKLTWKNHVSDLKKWNSSASATYGVKSIPKTFLIGRDGKVISTNTRGSLENQLLKAL